MIKSVIMKATLLFLSLALLGPALASLNPSELSPSQAELSPAVSGKRDVADEIWDDIQNAVTCGACQGILELLKGLVKISETLFLDTVIEVCKISGAEDDDVCEGAIRLEGPIIADALRHMHIGSDTSDEFCVTFLGLCRYPEVGNWTAPFPSSKPDTVRPPSSGKEPIKVVQFSDIHIDLLYEEGATTNCTKPICCRPYTPSDAPGNSSSPAGPNGDHNCDSPVSLEKSMYEAVKATVPDAAFVLFTGDVVDHAVWNTSQDYNTQEINGAYGLMSESLGLVYGTAGNHEASPVNAFQPSSVGNSAQWVYDVLANNWARWIGNDADASVEKIGAYSQKYPNGKLRLISLNTNFYYRQNYWLYQEPMITDPDAQLVWLINELDAAEKAGDNVYIIGHMPPGDSNAFHRGSNHLDQIFNRYSSTIAAMFFGHTHEDHFEITYSDYNNRTAENALIASYICPSLTPTSGYPSFRVYDVDPDTFGILDATTYIADMTNPAYQASGPVWTKYYSAKEIYGSALSEEPSELDAAFWHQVTETFESDDAAFQAYYRRKSRGWKADACTGDCKTQEICELRAARSQDNCYTPAIGVHFSKRSNERAEHRDECGISVSRASLNALAVKKETLKHVQNKYYAHKEAN